MRMITHDWADSYCITILSHLRAAAGPHSRLIIVDAIVQYACEDTTVAKDIPGGLEEEGRKAPEPLLPNWGHAALFRYLCDIQVRIVANYQVTTHCRRWDHLQAGEGIIANYILCRLVDDGCTERDGTHGISIREYFIGVRMATRASLPFS